MEPKAILLFLLFLLLGSCKDQESNIAPANTVLSSSYYDEPYRPQYHFSPEKGWMNDPNGLVYHDGLYHLFYQYYPHANVWGPMHWGHATSTDLVHWDHRPIALFPDEHGFIFSGSAVVDADNTSGLGQDGKVPLVALFTYFRMDEEKRGGTVTQKQGLAYSLDNGVTWTKYPGNPIIDNTDIKDFRDPKVFWHEESKRWVMALVAGDHVKLYRSQDLIQWTKISEFGKDLGAHGGVWECPDLFPLQVQGRDNEKWVLIISIGTGGPNGGSGTQYFVGDFDGTTFTTDQKEVKWLDWGTDNYAGVTYNNVPDASTAFGTGGERIFIGWMSNWGYALNTPTQPWRSAMTLPRTLSLGQEDGEYFLRNYPVNTVDDLAEAVDSKELRMPAQGTVSVTNDALNHSKISFTTKYRDFRMTFSNALGEQLNLIFDSTSKLVILDRTTSGKTGFEKTFGGYLHYMVMPEALDAELEGTIFMDSSSLELFINGGRYVMTEQIFPNQPYTQLTFGNMSQDEMAVREFSITRMEGIWKR